MPGHVCVWRLGFSQKQHQGSAIQSTESTYLRPLSILPNQSQERDASRIHGPPGEISPPGGRSAMAATVFFNHGAGRREKERRIIVPTAQSKGHSKDEWRFPPKISRRGPSLSLPADRESSSVMQSASKSRMWQIKNNPLIWMPQCDVFVWFTESDNGCILTFHFLSYMFPFWKCTHSRRHQRYEYVGWR